MSHSCEFWHRVPSAAHAADTKPRAHSHVKLPTVLVHGVGVAPLSVSQLCTRSSHSFTSLHVTPPSLLFQPDRHEQVKLPTLFLHSALDASQLCALFPHSFASVLQLALAALLSAKVSHPGAHGHVKLPTEFWQIRLFETSQSCAPFSHSFSSVQVTPPLLLCQPSAHSHVKLPTEF
eukprot:1464269-Rhodomonas_salina.1